MGKIIYNFLQYLDKEELTHKVIPLQEKVIVSIDKIFNLECISKLNYNYEVGIGERGSYLGKENYLFSVKFTYVQNYCFEFYFFYDQLEYFILEENNILKRCNLEDYTDNIDKMIDTFIKYLKSDLTKLNVPFQNQIKNNLD